MSDLGVQHGAGPVQADARLTQWQRAGDVFAAPSKTFGDIRRGNCSWWLPYLIFVVCTYILFAAITMKVGWQQVAQNNIAMSPKQAQRMDQLNPAQRATAMKIAGTVTEIFLAASPVLILIGASLVSLLLWGTINFVFGGKSKYQEIFAANMYAMLPRAAVPLIATIAIFAGLAPEAFNISNMAGTNVAYFLSVQDTSKALYALLSQIDVFNIWAAVLLSIGVAKVAGKNRGAGYITVFGWWTLWVLIRVALGFAAG